MTRSTQPLIYGTVPYSDLVHPEYKAACDQWTKWRLTYEGGHEYLKFYLKKFRRERWSDYHERRSLTYTPPNAKEAVNEILNAVFQRLGDVSRTGDQSYVDACKGIRGGVDRLGSSMAVFMGEEVLPEMLPMKEVGVWVDMPSVPEGTTKAEVVGKKPYLYAYPVEAIKSWAHDDEGNLVSVLLREVQCQEDPDTGLPISGDLERFRFARKTDAGVEVTIQDDKGNVVQPTTLLKISEIPFEWACIKHSLLMDTADMQKALLNMESTDVFYCVKANFPIYTEQKDPRPGGSQMRPAQQATKSTGVPAIPAGQAKEAGEAKDEEVTLGVTSGRAYTGERPDFIHPSPEPLKAAMAKEFQIKEDIRRSVHLSVKTLDPQMASAESKAKDGEGLQNGLLAIGMALEKLERRIAHFWSLYMGTEPAMVRYPEEWTMQSDSSRRAEAAALCELKDQIPSRTASKEILKLAADKLIGHKVSPSVLDVIHSEIDAAQCLTTNIDDLEKEIQLRIVSAETASRNRGYPEGEHDLAIEEQADQLRIIAISQTQGAGAAADPARGGLGDPASTGSKDEKALNAGQSGTPQDNTRGKGK